MKQGRHAQVSQLRTFLIPMSLLAFLHAAVTQRAGDTQLDPSARSAGSYGSLLLPVVVVS